MSTNAGEVLKRLLSSDAKGDLLVLFHKNPGLIDTLDEVARRIGRRGDGIKSDVKDLVDMGILKTKKVGDSEALFLDIGRDKEIQDAITTHLESLKIEEGA